MLQSVEQPSDKGEISEGVVEVGIKSSFCGKLCVLIWYESSWILFGGDAKLLEIR